MSRYYIFPLNLYSPVSIVALLVTVWVAFALSGAADAFPQVLWGWIHLPGWLGWFPLLAIVAWCMSGEAE